MRMTERLSRVRDDERGAVLVLVAIVLVVFFAVAALTVDLGSMVARRRTMVRLTDAATLAAAQACLTGEAKTFTGAQPAEPIADGLAVANLAGLNVSGQNIVLGESSGCGTGLGQVTTQYTSDQRLYFAPAVGLGSTGTVTAKATAAWGKPGPVPLTIVNDWESGEEFTSCTYPFDDGEVCYILFDNSHDNNTSSNWGWLNLECWWYPANPPPTSGCSAGGADLTQRITLQATYAQASFGTPAYVGTKPGNNSTWMALGSDNRPGIQGETRVFPISSASQSQADDQEWRYIIAFQEAMIINVWNGNDGDAEPTCGPSIPAPTNNQTCMKLQWLGEEDHSLELLRLVK